MKSLVQTLSTLNAMKYMQAQLSHNGELLANRLLPHGERYSAEIARHWWQTCFAGIKTQVNLAQAQHTNLPSSERVEFYKCAAFTQQLTTLREQARQQGAPEIPAVVRFAQHVEVLPSVTQIQLVCLYLCSPSTALEQYYKLQRERKIWWMRISFNPSRYYLEPHELVEHEHCQSINIKSRLSYSDLPVEHVSLVPLQKMTLPDNGKHFTCKDERHNKQILPTVLRTVTDLSLATYALLLDGCDHNRPNTLMLHRKLVPFQCAIAAVVEKKSVGEIETLTQLCQHIIEMLRHAGLRCYNDWDYVIDDKQLLKRQLTTADSLGIPYVVLVNKETLNTGFLDLRSRDTTLSETIHLSDLATYLPNICTH